MLPVIVSVSSSDELEESLPFRRILINAKDIPKDELAVLTQVHSQTDFLVQFPAPNIEDVISVLDAGALGAVIPPALLEDLVEAGVPAHRLAVSADIATATELVSAGGLLGVFVQWHSNPQEIKDLYALSESLVQKNGTLCQIFVDGAEHSYRDIGSAVPVIPGAKLTYDPSSRPERVSLSDVICSKLTTDRPDGLYLTVVCDQHGRALGTVYSSPESISESLRTMTGVYQSRKRGLWYKGASSGATQKLISISIDCDGDALQFIVEQNGPGFCHNNTYTCFGPSFGLEKLQRTVTERKLSAPAGSYTHRLFNDPKLLNSKLMEEAEELCDATSKSEIAWEAADLLYFLSVKLAQNGVTFKDVEANLDAKSRKIIRRTGNAKPKWAAVTEAKEKASLETAAGGADAAGGAATGGGAGATPSAATATHAAPTQAPTPIKMKLVKGDSAAEVTAALRRPAQSSNAFELARPIVQQVRQHGDQALIELTARFDKCQLTSPVLKAPFAPELMNVEPEIKKAIDLACDNVEKFHAAQLTKDMSVETAPGVVCSRFARPIARVGLYVPGGTAVLPSTAIMLGVPAKVAGCSDIIFASPPRQDGTVTPEVVYVAHKVGAKQIVLAGGAQAVAAMAYGTDTVTKCDKILGPGNQFVTAAKMIVQTDLDAQVSIDMPAGPSEVLVVADKNANKTFVVSDLLSQAEHGPDSQVILIAIDWTDRDVEELQAELDKQARALPRFDVICKSIAHSTIITVPSRSEAIRLSNMYAPEHLILQVDAARDLVKDVTNAGSVFVGALSPESCGDYTSGTNHTLPTYGYANQYSGVNTGTFLKHITSQELTPQGMKNIGPATVALARREGLDGHANAVVVRLAELNR